MGDVGYYHTPIPVTRFNSDLMQFQAFLTRETRSRKGRPPGSQPTGGYGTIILRSVDRRSA